jgi:death-on-curing family protein
LNILISKKLREERMRLGKDLPDQLEVRSRIHQLTCDDVLDAHFAIADFFYREDYGMAGVGYRDIGVFISTIERQFTSFGGSSVCVGEFEEIATLLYGIIKNHPFYDANKRTAFLCCLVQLHRLGRTITVPEKEFEDLMVQIAEGSIGNKAALKGLRKARVERPEIKFLARYLQKNSRKNARLSATIKFRDLRSIVEGNGFAFANANRGTIDLVKTEERRVPRFFFSDRIERTNRVLLNIAYHGEGIDVPNNTLRLVRQACGLTEQDGFDGEVLLRDATPTFQLIKSYRTALQNLAYR